MLIDELIKRLEAIRKKHGSGDVLINTIHEAIEYEEILDDLAYSKRTQCVILLGKTYTKSEPK